MPSGQEFGFVGFIGCPKRSFAILNAGGLALPEIIRTGEVRGCKLNIRLHLNECDPVITKALLAAVC